MKRNGESLFEVPGSSFELRPFDLAAVVDALVCILDLNDSGYGSGGRGCGRYYVQWKQPLCWC